MNLLPKEIVYIALNRWDSLFQREQHLMLGLSKTFRILFVDPPLSFPTIFWGKIKGEKYTFRSQFCWVSDRLAVYTPPAFPPFSQYIKLIHHLHTSLFIFLLKKKLNQLNFNDYIIGIGRPFLGESFKKFNPRLSYYDCSDDYLESPRLKGNKRLLRAVEEKTIKSVDLVFCSSHRLRDIKCRWNRNCFVIPNGVEISFMEQNLQEEDPVDIAGIKGPILGYIGVIDERLDFDLLNKLAKAKPHWSIVLVGPSISPHSMAGLKEQPNVYFLGTKNYQDLYRYLKRFDVCLIPFKINAFTQKIYPTKLHQYLAAGKPVVSSPLPELKIFSPWIEFYLNFKEMKFKIERAILEDSEEKAMERRRVARENTWDRRVELTIKIFREYL